MFDFRRRAVIAAVLLLATGCGGAHAPSRPAAATSTPSAVRTITAGVGGRELSGHCRGTRRTGAPVIVLESGMGGGQNQLADIEQRFGAPTMVCAYDRAGVGASDAAPKTPRAVSALVTDLEAFIGAVGAPAPYLLVGHSMGANVVVAYAQAHPDQVAGLVAMNPVPPAETWLSGARKAMTKAEFADERAFYRGENDEHTSFLEPTLNHPLPADTPFAVLFDEDCDGDTGFCHRILPALTRATKSLAGIGGDGRFVRARGAGHDIFASAPQVVQRAIDDVLNP